MIDDDLRVRIGRVRDRGRGSARRGKPFIARALAAAEKAGGLHPRSGRSARTTAFGRGRAASLAAADGAGRAGPRHQARLDRS